MVHKIVFTPREELKIEAYITPIIKANSDITMEEIASKLDDEMLTILAKGMTKEWDESYRKVK